MKYANCIALSRIIGPDYYKDAGETVRLRLSEATALGPSRVKILSVEDDEGPPPPRPPTSGTLAMDAAPNNRMMKKQQHRSNSGGSDPNV